MRPLLVGALVALTACSDTPVQVLPETAFDAALGAAPSPQAGDTVPGGWIIQFASGVDNPHALAAQLGRQHGGRVTHVYESALRGFAVEQLPPQAVAALQRNPNVTLVEPDLVVTAGASQVAPTWALDRIDQRTRPLDGTYSYVTEGAGVHAYIFDTGIRTSHVEFEGRANGVYTSITDGNGTNDCNGHGTHVAGTVGGKKYGIAKKVSLHAVRVLGCNGSGSLSGVIAAIDWVTNNRQLPAVANMSLSGDQSLSQNIAVRNSIAAGVVYVVAAGNNGADACSYSPSSTTEALTVGSIWNGDGISSFSNRGPCVDLFAPGEAIRSAFWTSDTTTMQMGGTSMASPHVAGTVARYLSAHPTATPAQVHAAIVGGATSNVLNSIPAGSPNLLLYTGVADAGAPPPPPPTDAAPVARFTLSCANPLTCSFDGRASTDDVGITSYSWNYGDGSSGSGSTGSHTYAAAGSYVVSLTVRDGASQISTTTATAVVTAPPPPPPAVDAAPVASFTSSCPKGKCTFDATSSTDDKGIVDYAWSFGDGATLQASGLRIVTHAYGAKGSYTVRLTVTDAAGQRSTKSITVNIRKL